MSINPPKNEVMKSRAEKPPIGVSQVAVLIGRI
jgi:hypothetical protein